MSTVSAAIRLRNQVTAVPNTVVFVKAGHPDEIIRFQVLPKALEKLQREVAEASGDKSKEPKWPVLVNLDWGPAQEAWSTARREFLLTARRDRPVPEPLPVAKDSHEEWSVADEDVPVVENAIAGPNAKIAETTCETCGVDFKSDNGLKIHKGRTKH